MFKEPTCLITPKSFPENEVCLVYALDMMVMDVSTTSFN
jgi:hypothetical protein